VEVRIRTPLKNRSELDELDFRILESLKKDARKPLLELSREHGVSDVTIATRIRQMQQIRIIRGFSVLLDYEKLGSPVSAFVAIRIRPGTADSVGAALALKDWIVGIYEMHGFCDLMLKVRAESLDELRERVVNEIGRNPDIISKDVMTILKIGKEDWGNSYGVQELAHKKPEIRKILGDQQH
jgi:Lrp/AsnC family transcriptional regulator, leucine-responsive regulatory protein